MNLSSDLISQFVKITNDTEKPKTGSTAYGTIVMYNDKLHVQLDGSDLLTPISTTTDVKENERVIVMIKDHTATVTGNTSSPAARTDAVKDVDKKVDEIGNQITEFEIVIADKVDTKQLAAESARIDELRADNVTIKKTLTAYEADITNLKADDVTIKGTLTANTADIETLKTTKLDADVAELKYAEIDDLTATNADIHNLNADYGAFKVLATDNFSAIDATIKNLDSTYATIVMLNAEKARITDLEANSLTASSAVIKNLQADVADIDTLIFGSASGDVIQSTFANAVIAQLGNAQIKSAMIESISADKITAGDILTNNVRVLSEDGKLLISDETIQISDDSRVRVQIGKDASNDYSINIWDEAGNLMFSKGGITDSAIKEAIIRDDMVSETANIKASKLDISSLFEEINGSSKTINSSKIYIDAEKQTLDVAFTSLTTDVSELGETVSSQGTSISTIQGQITSKIWQQDINTAKSELENDISGVDAKTTTLSTQYSELNQELGEISATVASHTTQISNKADSSTVTTVNNKVTNLEADLGGFKTTVSSTYVTKIDNEAALDALTTRVSNAESNIIQTNGQIALMVKTEDLETTLAGYYNKTDTEALIDTRADSIELSVSEVRTEIENIDIGGRNLLRNTQAFDPMDVVYSALTGESYRGLAVRYLDKTSDTEGNITFVQWSNVLYPKHGEVYTFSFYAKGTGSIQCFFHGQSGCMQTVSNVSSQGNIGASGDGAMTVHLTEDWQRYWIRWTLKDSGPEDIYKHVLMRLHYGNAAYICGAKLEQGNRATDWSPAPEDQNEATQEVANVLQTTNETLSDLQITVDGISTTVSNHTTQIANKADGSTVTEVNNRVSSLEQNVDSFKTTVSSTYSTKTELSQTDLKATNAQNTANDAAISASNAQNSADAAQNDINNLNVGGRNLIANTSLDTVYSGNKGSNSYKDVWTGRTINIPTATEYVVSFDAKADVAQTIKCFFYNPSTTISAESSTGYKNASVTDGNSEVNITTEWKRYWVKWTQTPATSVKSVIVGRALLSDNVYIRAVKLEEGNTPTSWSPAPEDQTAATQEVANVLQTTNETLSDLQVTVSGISTTVSEHTTQIANKADGSEVTEVNNKVSSLEQNVNGFKTTVSSTYATKDALSNTDQKASDAAISAQNAQDDIDNLNIGGRNLLLNTNGTGDITVVGGTYATAGMTSRENNGICTFNCAVSSPNEIYYRFAAPSSTELYIFEPGESYTFSCKAQVTTNSGTLTGLAFRAQSYSEGAWRGGVNDRFITSDTTDWVDYNRTITVESAAEAYYISVQLYYEDSWDGVIQLKDLKLEKGNRATDWTPAPEDVDSDIQSVTDVANGLVGNMETILGDGTEENIGLIKTLETEISQTNDAWKLAVSETEETIGGIDEKIGGVQTKVNEYSTWFTMDENGFTIAKTEDGEVQPLKVVIDNTSMNFYDNDVKVAYVSGQKLKITEAEVEGSLYVGGFRWSERSNGNMGLMWIGG